jgi:TPR repeat protein
MSRNLRQNSRTYFEAVEEFNRGEFAACIDKFLALSDQGDAYSSLYAATIFDRGSVDVDHDWARARRLYKISLEQSYLPGAALGLALMLYHGRGGTQDFAESGRNFELLRNNAFSQIMLGVMSLKGKGRSQDENLALTHFDEAWRLGHPIGLKNAAIIRLHRGKYVRGTSDFVRGGVLCFWYYGIKRLPMIKSPRDTAEAIA